jgi:hypothetical protein
MKPGRWWLSIILNIVLWIYFFPGIALGLAHPWLGFLMDAVRTPANIAVFSLLAFWITGACFRTFRARSWESAVLLITGFCVVLRNAPSGSLLVPPIDSISDWLMSNPSPGAGAGILIGSAIGAASVAFRQITGLERGYLGVQAEEA